MLYYCFITLLKEKQYERTRKTKSNCIETLFHRNKSLRHSHANRRTSKHGILLDQERNTQRTVVIKFKRLSLSKAKMRAPREDHSYIKICPMRRDLFFIQTTEQISLHILLQPILKSMTLNNCFHALIIPTTILFVNLFLRRLNKEKYIVRIIDLKKICCVP